MPLLSRLIDLALWVMMMAILGSIVISWLRAFRVNVPHTNPLVRAIEDTADLMLRPIRRSIPTAGGGLDFAPMIALVILYIVRAMLMSLARGV